MSGVWRFVGQTLTLMGGLFGVLGPVGRLNDRWLSYLALNVALSPRGPSGTWPLVGPLWLMVSHPVIDGGWWAGRTDAGIAWALAHPRLVPGWLHRAGPAAFSGGMMPAGGLGGGGLGDVGASVTFFRLIEIPLLLFILWLVVWRLRRNRETGRVERARSRKARGEAVPLKEKLREARSAKTEKETIERTLGQEEAARERKELRARLRREGWTTRDGYRLGTLYGDGWRRGRGVLGVMRGLWVTIPDDEVMRHVQIIGGTGAGKTAAMLLRFIYAEVKRPWAKRASWFVFDPKPGSEITRLTGPYMRRHGGYTVLVYDPTHPGSVRYNFMALCPSSAQLASLISRWVYAAGIHHEHYHKEATDLLTGFAVMLRVRATQKKKGQKGATSGEIAWAWVDVSMADVADFLDTHSHEEIVAALWTARELVQDPALNRVANKLEDLGSNKRSRESIMRAVRDALSCLDDPTVRNSCRGMDVSWPDMVVDPTMLYCAINMDESYGLKPLVVTLLVSGTQALVKHANGKRLSRRVVIGADEFVNMGKVEDMDHIASTVRAAGIGLIAMTQGPDDIAHEYGGDAYHLLSSILTTIVLSGSPPAALQRVVSPALGLSLDKLMEQGTAAVIRAVGPPLRIYTHGWYEWRGLRRAVGRLTRTDGKQQLLREQLALRREMDKEAVEFGTDAEDPALLGEAQVETREEDGWIDEEAMEPAPVREEPVTEEQEKPEEVLIEKPWLSGAGEEAPVVVPRPVKAAASATHQRPTATVDGSQASRGGVADAREVVDDDLSW